MTPAINLLKKTNVNLKYINMNMIVSVQTMVKKLPKNLDLMRTKYLKLFWLN